jgi:hypothetical protein
VLVKAAVSRLRNVYRCFRKCSAVNTELLVSLKTSQRQTSFRRILLFDFVRRQMFFPLKTTFRKLALLPSSDKKVGGRGGTYYVGSLGKS